MRLATGEVKTYFYAWRGGPQIKAKPGTPDFVGAYNDAHAQLRRPSAGMLMRIIAEYKASPEFTRLAPSSRRAYLIYIKLIENEFGDLPLSALADRRVRGEFKTWRDSFAATPRKADYAWTTLARMSFAKDRGMIATNPARRAAASTRLIGPTNSGEKPKSPPCSQLPPTRSSWRWCWRSGPDNARAICCGYPSRRTTAVTSDFGSQRLAGE